MIIEKQRAESGYPKIPQYAHANLQLTSPLDKGGPANTHAHRCLMPIPRLWVWLWLRRQNGGHQAFECTSCVIGSREAKVEAEAQAEQNTPPEVKVLETEVCVRARAVSCAICRSSAGALELVRLDGVHVAWEALLAVLADRHRRPHRPGAEVHACERRSM